MGRVRLPPLLGWAVSCLMHMQGLALPHLSTHFQLSGPKPWRDLWLLSFISHIQPSAHSSSSSSRVHAEPYHFSQSLLAQAVTILLLDLGNRVSRGLPVLPLPSQGSVFRTDEEVILWSGNYIMSHLFSKFPMAPLSPPSKCQSPSTGEPAKWVPSDSCQPLPLLLLQPLPLAHSPSAWLACLLTLQPAAPSSLHFIVPSTWNTLSPGVYHANFLPSFKILLP